MRTLVKQMLHKFKVFFLFVGFTILFYIGMVWLNDEYQNYNKYEEPDGASLKVSNNVEYETDNWFNRLKQFYLNGE